MQGYLHRALCLIALSVVVWPSDDCLGQTPVWLDSSNTPEDSQQIERALASRGSVSFADTPLDEAIEQLSSQFGVQMKLSSRRLNESAVSEVTPLTLTADNLPLESILKLLLEEIELGWTITDNVLLITTFDDLNSAERFMYRAYPVLDLVSVADAGDGRPDQIDFDPLIEVITATIAPQSWDAVGGPGSVAGHANTGTIVVAQTWEIQRRIERLLASLREVRGSQQPAVAVRTKSPQTKNRRKRTLVDTTPAKRYSAAPRQAWQIPLVHAP